jgi:ATP-binding cassette, subfamily C, bacterial LapB
MKIRSERDVRAPRSFFRQFSGKISVQRVAFRYAQRQEAVLRGVQLEIKPGEMIAITGASGVGKTTLLRLIAGLYPPSLGAVLVDDMDLRQIDPTEWRSQIAFLPETTNFFYGTLAQNIRLSRPDASDAQILRALKEMGLDSEELGCLETTVGAGTLFHKGCARIFAGQPGGLPRHSVRTAFA